MSKQPFGPAAEEIEQLLDYIGFTVEDAERIRSYGALLEPLLKELAEKLYDHIETVPLLKGLLDGHLQQCRVKQSAYLKQLLMARVDTTYAASRAWIGEVHRLMGIEPKWYMASYCHLEHLIVTRIAAHPALENDPATVLAVALSLRKLICFDTIVANDAYEHALQANHQRRERLLEELSHPAVLDIGEGVSVIPLVGSVDVERVRALHGSFLQAFARGARALIVDMSRLTELDAEGAELMFELLRDMTPSLRVFLAGFSPSLERGVVSQGAVPRGLRRAPTLAEAVQEARVASAEALPMELTADGGSG